ncbi:MAG: hypothetical protein ACJ8CR_31975 [Roseiflexaceae bacterium]
MIRTIGYWKGYAAWMYTDWIAQHCAQVFVATRSPTDHDLSGYVLAHFYDQEYVQRVFGSPPWFYISEIGACTYDGAVIPALLAAVARAATQRGMGYGQLALPHEPQIDAALADLFGRLSEEQAQLGTVMMRALTPDAQPDLEATHTAPKAIIWELDRY